MRKTLFAAAALAPICILVTQTSAFAQTSATTVGSNTATPITTAQDGDVTINGGVTVQPTSPNTTAVLLNSNNSVVNSGAVTYSNLNNVVAIGAEGGFTGSITNSGTILLNDSYTPPQPDNLSINAAPFASPTSAGRIGILLSGGAGPLTGTIENLGTITVTGDTSYGILLNAPLVGSLINSGAITYTGDNPLGTLTAPTGGGLVSTAAGSVSGDVTISAAVTALGANSPAVSLSGDIGGRFSLYSSLTSTNYSETTRPAAGTSLQTIQTISQLTSPNGGSALTIAGNVGAGIFIAAPPTNYNSSDITSDRDGDGLIDSAEPTGAVTSYGGVVALPTALSVSTATAAAPAFVIGGVNNITIGGFQATPTTAFTQGYGVIIEGTVAGEGVYDNVSSTAMQIGGLGGTVSIPGGLLVAGSVEATGYGDVSELALHIGAGASLSTLVNSGTIGASVSPPNSTSTTFPSFTATATGILIEPGAVVTSLVNSGSIQAALSGDKTDTLSAAALVDKSGSLSSVTNTGIIAASLTADAVDAAPVGTGVALANGALAGSAAGNTSGTVALDLSNNTTGVTLIQQQPGNTIVTTDTSSGSPVVTITTAAAPTGTIPITTVSTEVSVTTGAVTVETITPVSPNITGDIYLGNGPNTVAILAGSVNGAISMGSGPTASVTIDGGAIYAGALSYSGTSGAGLTLNVNNGTYDNISPTSFKTASFTVGAQGLLYIGVDPANNRAAFYNVSGAATIANGGKIGLVFDSNASGPQTYTILQAGTLNLAGATAATLLGPVPYLFNAAVTVNQAADSLAVSISPKTSAELGANPSQAAALTATNQAIALDTPVQTAFLNQYTRAGFYSVYNQILPDYAGGTFQAANAASLAISRATSEANEIENPSGSRGAWVQELFVGVNHGTGTTDGFQGGGFGFVGGVETGGSGLGAFGVTAAIVDTSMVDPHLQGDSQTSMAELELGGYWQGEIHGITADARIGGGYASMSAKREFVQFDATTNAITLDRRQTDHWNAYTATAHFGLAYRHSFGAHFFGGGWFLQPQAHLDAFYMTNDNYNENPSEGGPALSLAVGRVTGNEGSGTASVLFGRQLGTGLVFRPELELGVRDTFTGTAGNQTDRYLAGGTPFTLTPADIQGGAALARLRLKASSEYYELGVEAGGEIMSSRYQEADMKFSVRVLF